MELTSGSGLSCAIFNRFHQRTILLLGPWASNLRSIILACNSAFSACHDKLAHLPQSSSSRVLNASSSGALPLFTLISFLENIKAILCARSITMFRAEPILFSGVDYLHQISNLATIRHFAFCRALHDALCTIAAVPGYLFN
jgi:hypothetical protein